MQKINKVDHLIQALAFCTLYNYTVYLKGKTLANKVNAPLHSTYSNTSYCTIKICEPTAGVSYNLHESGSRRKTCYTVVN